MPSKTPAQHRLMEGIAHGMTPRSSHAPSVEVAKEFVAADKGKKFIGHDGKPCGTCETINSRK